MWLPMVLENMNDMHALGLQLSADDIYSVNHSSLKDAVVLFGGGCTGEVISNQGLILTNHHCGLGQIQSHSSVDHDYISDGFWAMNKSEELTCPDLTVTFIISMTDVTDQFQNLLQGNINEQRRTQLVDSLSKAIATDAVLATGYDGIVKPFAYGNQFILILSQTFRDIRLVGAPPISIGDFGGETDNWVWPRHTGDFSLFRIYSDSNGQPAKYSADNIPYQPKYFFPIDTAGVHQGDFAMVYGFPGKTAEYVSSYAVELKKNVTDPIVINMRTLRLNIWWDAMLKNDTTRIQYTSKYNGVANSWKKSQGEILGLNKYDVIGLKQQRELQFQQTADKDSPWNDVLGKLKLEYDTLRNLEYQVDYYNEALMTPEIFKLAALFQNLQLLCNDKSTSADKIEAEATKLINQVTSFYKDYNVVLDEQIAETMMTAYYQNLPDSLQINYMQIVAAVYKGKISEWVSTAYSMSILADKNKLLAWLKTINQKSIKQLNQDPLFIFWQVANTYFTSQLQPAYNKVITQINILNRQYYHAQTQVFPDQKFYPDANSTLRVSYGTIQPYEPKDGVEYNWFTTLEGVEQKSELHTEDFQVPQKLLDLLHTKNFGTYADADGTMHICFITNCHTTGGNSGSPVLNGKGELIGTNFDRVWEGTMSDLYFNADICRNIVLDVRYTLFIIDKYAGAGYLLGEMKLTD